MFDNVRVRSPDRQDPEDETRAGYQFHNARADLFWCIFMDSVRVAYPGFDCDRCEHGVLHHARRRDWSFFYISVLE